MKIEELLQNIDIFSRLNSRQIARLAKIATRREFAAGTQILRRGDTGVALYLIVSGRVSVTLPSEETGAEIMLRDMGPGQAFGEMALIDEAPRSANVTAAEPTTCMVLTRWDFGGEMRHDPQIAQALLPVLCMRLRKAEERLIKYEPDPTTE
jgi:CRP/FNR family transcriptional regulator, cyclic AMP receptor protein